MKKLIDIFFKLMELGVVLCLFAMVIMVFGNVVMRYVFNSGILISEEMSRYAFIWLTYLGAMVAMREGGHLGVDTLFKHLPLTGKKVSVFLSESLMLLMNGMFLWGTFKMHELQVTNISPVAGISMIWIYGLGYVVAVVMGIFNIHKLFLLLTGQLSEEQMLTVVETEGIKEVEQNIEQLKKA
ncbi:TRAP transporter small permease [Variovorax sp. PCZ-1]|uniref:TRAP transporter small permease n=1 Tax=Variovorax sp. PCZ-1 TaxID=2835533 RepID=UPI001BCAA41F|nr:TRAP transporter small permease [Variovorax sp. PCZ-1]MBS7806164.1 TRAP transporter small permease [Variovorax sp. PCZ-1]